MKSKVALITGITGQDGSLLAEYLLKHNYKIIAPTRKSADKIHLKHTKIADNTNISFVTYEKWSDFDAIINENQIDELYHLAAMSHVGLSHNNPEQVFDVNTMWTLKIIDALVNYSAQSRFFFASSSEIFASDTNRPICEGDEKQASNPYGISKLAAHNMVNYYREVHGLFASIGILFNHESELRADNFVSKKICREVARIVKHGGKPLMLGNIHAKKDWGYAYDYVKTYHAMLQCDKADDYIIATGKLHSVKDMVDCAFNALDFHITWQGADLSTRANDGDGNCVVGIDEKYFRPLDNHFSAGNNQKARDTLNFKNLTPFSQWVKSMTQLEYAIL